MIESSVARPTPHAARAASTAASSHRRAERRRCAGSTERGGARLEFGGGPRLRNGDHRGRIFGLFEGTATAVADGRGTTNSDAPLRHLCRPFPPPSAPRRSVVRAPRRGGVCVGGMGLAARHLASPSTSPRLASPHHLTSPRLASPPHLASLSLRGTPPPLASLRGTPPPVRWSPRRRVAPPPVASLVAEFLNRCFAHEDLQTSHTLKVFCLAKPDSWAQARRTPIQSLRPSCRTLSRGAGETHASRPAPRVVSPSPREAARARARLAPRVGGHEWPCVRRYNCRARVRRERERRARRRPRGRRGK